MKKYLALLVLSVSLVFLGGCVVPQAQYEIMDLKHKNDMLVQWFVIALLVNNAAWFYFYGRKP